MRDDLPIWLLVAAKALAYCWLFAVPRLHFPVGRRPPLHRPVVAGLVRLLLGLMLGIPFGALLYRFGPGISIPAFSFFRLGLWITVTLLAYPKLPWTTALLFSIGATALNTLLDFSIGHWATVHFGLC